MCRACRAERFFRNMYRHVGKDLVAWQIKVIRDIYGHVDLETGLRIYRDGYVSMAKKNGKTFLVGGMPIYHLMVEDTEDQASVISAAAARQQATLVFEAAAYLIAPNPTLRDAFKVRPSTRTIVHTETMANYRVVAADGKVNDGQGPSLLIMDELHQWTNKAHETNRDVLTRGGRARREPLRITITTAGVTNECPMWSREHAFAQSVLSGAIQKPTYYAAIWSADEEKLRKDPEYWKSREARVAANPSHEDHPGGFLRDAELTDDLDKAIAAPSEQSKYFRYTLNVESSSEARYIPATDWSKGAVQLRPTLGRRCYAGVDLGETSDMCAMVLVFPDDDGTYDILPFFWAPKEKLFELERKTRQPYHAWIREGYLIEHPGGSVEYTAVLEKLLWAREEFDLKATCVDRWHAKYLIQDLEEKHGWPEEAVIEVPQNHAALSTPCKTFRNLCFDGRIRHGSHPILNWHADCATVEADKNDNIKPVKPARNSSPKRVDGIAAIVNAMFEALKVEADLIPQVVVF